MFSNTVLCFVTNLCVNVLTSLWPQFPYLYNFKNNIDASSPDVTLRSQNEIPDTTRVSCDVMECFCRPQNADLSAQVPRYHGVNFINPFAVNTTDPNWQTRSLRLTEVKECAQRQESELSGRAGGDQARRPRSRAPPRGAWGPQTHKWTWPLRLGQQEAAARSCRRGKASLLCEEAWPGWGRGDHQGLCLQRRVYQAQDATHSRLRPAQCPGPRAVSKGVCKQAREHARHSLSS